VDETVGNVPLKNEFFNNKEYTPPLNPKQLYDYTSNSTVFVNMA